MSVYRVFLIAILCGVLFGISGYWGEGVILLLDIVNILAFGEFCIEKTYIFFFLMRYFPLFIFQAVMGTYLYRRFCTASVYFFSRQENKTRWFVAEAIKLYGSTLLYLLILAISFIFCMVLKNGVAFNEQGIIFFMYYLMIHSLWLFSMTLLINVLAIRIGSSNSFIFVAGIQIAYIAYYVVFEQVLSFETREKIDLKANLLKLNPLSHLVIKWHSSNGEILKNYLNEFDIDFPLSDTVFLFFMIVFVTLMIGKCIVKKHDFIVNNYETGGTS